MTSLEHLQSEFNTAVLCFSMDFVSPLTFYAREPDTLSVALVPHGKSESRSLRFVEQREGLVARRILGAALGYVRTWY